MMSATEQSVGANIANYQTWLPSNGLTTFTDKFLGTIDGNPLVFRVNKNRAGRMDFDLNLGQASFGYGALKNAWLGAAGYTGDLNPLRNYMGTKNTAFGYEAMTNTNIGKENVAVGYRALQNNQSYNGMVAIGFESMANFTDAFTAAGYNQTHSASLQATNAYSTNGFNTAVGYQSLKGSATVANNTGLSNTAMGYQSMAVNTSGATNTAVGYLSLWSNSTGSGNVAIGEESLKANTTNSNNVAVGSEALLSSTADNNVALGFRAGTHSIANTTGGQNTYLGAYTYTSNGGFINSTALGYNAQITASNMIQLGNASVSLVNTSGVLKTVNGTGSTSTATGALQVSGGVGITENIWVGGNDNVAGTLTVGGVQTFGGASTFNGAASFNQNVSIASTRTFTVGTGATSLGGTLTVAGVSTFNNNVTVSSGATFTVGTSATVLGGSLTVAGTTTLNGNALLATTPSSGDYSKKIATTEYVIDALKTSNNGWTSDGNTGMSIYSLSTYRDMMSATEQSVGANIANYQTWLPSN
jgi:hypothetical protein